MKRRDFIGLAASIAVAWPRIVSAQERVRRVGVLLNLAVDDPESRRRVTALVQTLGELGWTEGRNLQIDYRSGLGNAERYRRYSAELVSLVPDVILAGGGTSAGAVQQATHTVPIVFVQAADPVSRGLVASLNRPGSNTTGFSQYDFAMSAKWLELLKEIAPNVTRAAVIRDPTQFSSIAVVAAIQALAPTFRVEINMVDPRNPGEIERAITTFAKARNGGLITLASASADRHRELIVGLTAQYRLPAVYVYRYMAAAGGLISYGPDIVDQYRRAAGYIDRILKGEKPADLPVQEPTKYELVINLKTAKALGLTVPPSLLARADEVIE
jgi:putative ABC transport system substrate-binding protein